MIKEITMTNFYSFEQETIKINLDTNILVGINGSGKSNFFKVIRLLKEGVAGIGLKKQLIEHWGGFDNFFFKGAKKTKNRSVIITFRIDGIKIGLPMPSDLHYQITISGNIELMLEEARLNSSIHVSNISDGTLRYLCLLAILYNPDRGNFICIDEPEVGLHPDMILNIANAIKKTSTISTLAISTHSENLLNHFDLEHIRVFEKDDNNATHVCTYSDEQFADWYEHFSVGNMWRKGDLGGVRYGS